MPQGVKRALLKVFETYLKDEELAKNVYSTLEKKNQIVFETW